MLLNKEVDLKTGSAVRLDLGLDYFPKRGEREGGGR